MLTTGRSKGVFIIEADVLDEFKRKSEALLNEALSKIRESQDPATQKNLVLLGKNLQEKQRVIDELNLELIKHKELLVKKDQEFEGLKRKIEETRKAYDKASDQSFALGESMKMMRQQLEQKAELINKLGFDSEKTRREGSERITTANKEIERLQNLLSQKDAMIAKANAEASETRQSIDIMKRQLDQKTELITRLGQDIEKMRKDFSVKNNVLLEMQNKNRQSLQRMQEMNALMIKTRTSNGVARQSLLETEEKNKKMMADYLKMQTAVKSLKESLEKKDVELRRKEAELTDAFDSFKKDSEIRSKAMIGRNTREIVGLRAHIDRLNRHITQLKSIIEAKERKEQDVVAVLNERFRDLLETKGRMEAVPALRTEVKTEAPKAPRLKDLGVGSPYETENAEPAKRVPGPAASEVSFEPGFTPGIAQDEQAYFQYHIDDITPMIELGLEHGDTEEQIVKSLVSSGYKQADVEKALSQVVKH